MASTPSVPSPQLFSLQGKNALITGGSRGIGAACALALAQAGANICLILRDPSSATHTLSLLHSTPIHTSTLLADLSSPTHQSLSHIIPTSLTLFPSPHLDILVNCAGIQRRAPATSFSESDWDDVLDINLKAAWLLAQAAGTHMTQRKSGKIINFCSLLTFQGGLTVPAYAAAKGALGQLTKALSNEWSKDNVQVNAICPGYIDTDMNSALLSDPIRLRQISERIPAGRWGTPADFAGPIVFLASAASQYVSGELLVVDGGWMGR